MNTPPDLPQRPDLGAAAPVRHAIALFRHEGQYFARGTDPLWLDLFGQDTLPTPHTADADPLDVLHETTTNNPECDVRLVATPSTERYLTTRAVFRNAPSAN